MAQNLMSVAGVSNDSVGDACAVLAAGFMDVAVEDPAPEETALRRPDCTVDFSACVALVVRR